MAVMDDQITNRVEKLTVANRDGTLKSFTAGEGGVVRIEYDDHLCIYTVYRAGVIRDIGFPFSRVYSMETVRVKTDTGEVIDEPDHRRGTLMKVFAAEDTGE